MSSLSGAHLTISLLHATYHRPGGPAEVRDAWLAGAERPDRVEYVVAMDADDDSAIGATTGWKRVLSPPSSAITAVRNWNAAASIARGALMVTIADDLFPPRGWDTQLDAIVGVLDPIRTAFAVKVALHRRGCRSGLKPPVSSRLRAM